MEFVYSFIPKVLDLFDILYAFFFTPMSDLLGTVASFVVSDPDSFIGGIMSSVFGWLFSLNPIFENFTLIEFLLGGGLAVFLLWKLVKFILPLLE